LITCLTGISFALGSSSTLVARGMLISSTPLSNSALISDSLMPLGEWPGSCFRPCRAGSLDPSERQCAG
jgi:hypothetical protein